MSPLVSSSNSALRRRRRVLLGIVVGLLIIAISTGAEGSGGGSAPSVVKTADLACGACRAVARALLKGLATGAAAASKARSPSGAAQVGDLVEGVCRHLEDHARMRHPVMRDRWSIVSLIRQDKQPVDLERLEADPGLNNWLRMRCEELLDDREAEVQSLLLTGGSAMTERQLEASLCASLSRACSEEQLGLDFVPPLDPILASGAKKLDLNFVKGGEL